MNYSHKPCPDNPTYQFETLLFEILLSDDTENRINPFPNHNMEMKRPRKPARKPFLNELNTCIGSITRRIK